MARLIDADALIDNAREMVFEDINATGYGYSWDAVTVTDIMNAPTIEAAPVVHGRWLSKGGKISRFCSACFHDEPYKFADAEAHVYNFCPNCGAKMRTKVKL